MTSPQLDPEAILEWLQTSCAAQGVPLVIRDHTAIAQVAALLGHPAVQPRRTIDGARETDVDAGRLRDAARRRPHSLDNLSA